MSNRRVIADSRREPANPAPAHHRPPRAHCRRPGHVPPGHPGSPQQLATSRQATSLTSNARKSVADILQPAEIVTLSILRSPRCVRLEWREGANQGREVLYQRGRPDARQDAQPRSCHASPSPPIARSLSATAATPSARPGSIPSSPSSSSPSAATRPATTGSDTISYGGVESPFPGAPACHKLERLTATGETWLVYLDEQNPPALPRSGQRHPAETCSNATFSVTSGPTSPNSPPPPPSTPTSAGRLRGPPRPPGPLARRPQKTRPAASQPMRK